MFNDDLIREYYEWKNANPDNFGWWSFVNMKSDLQTALGFARFYYPDVIEVDGCFILKEKYSHKIFQSWKKECSNDKTNIEKMVNLYQVKDFFHINTLADEKFSEQILTLANILQHFWSMSFRHRFPNRVINVQVYNEDSNIYITVFEEVN